MSKEISYWLIAPTLSFLSSMKRMLNQGLQTFLSCQYRVHVGVQSNKRLNLKIPFICPDFDLFISLSINT